MKKKTATSRHGKMVAIIVIALFCVLFISVASYAQPAKDKQGKVMATNLSANQQETNKLIQQLMDDRLIDQVKGFVIEKKQNRLYIDGQQQPVEISNKYLAAVKQAIIRVQVFSLQERLRQHPESNLYQIITPITLSSGCVDYTPAKRGKEGC